MNKSPIEQLRELEIRSRALPFQFSLEMALGEWEGIFKIALTLADQLEKALAGNVWVSVKDRLPAPNTEVLVTNANGLSDDERDPQVAHLDDDWFYVAPWNFSLFKKAAVTHWMPLPNPPEASEQSENGGVTG